MIFEKNVDIKIKIKINSTLTQPVVVGLKVTYVTCHNSATGLMIIIPISISYSTNTFCV